MSKNLGIKKAPRTYHGHCHGGSNFTPEYRAWKAMIERCENPNSKPYPDYGGRGIRVHSTFRTSFLAFLAEIGHRPSKEHSLDRIDNSKGYEPGNVRWATRREQNRNNRRTRFVTYRGRTMSIAGWAEEFRVPYHILYARLKRELYSPNVLKEFAA